MISIPALLSTGAWAAVTIVLVVAFGRTEGGAWSIVGGVARGVRDWSRERLVTRTRSSSPFSGQLPPMRIQATPATVPSEAAGHARDGEPVPTARIEEDVTRPIQPA